jgi:hypothetical protein
MPHWIVTLAAAVGGCLLVVAGAFAVGRFLDALSRRKRGAGLRL